jgi:cytochrome c
MKRAIRAACVVLGAAVVLGLPSAAPAAPAPSQGVAYKVLVFTKTAGEQHASTSAGVSALRALGKQHRFTVVETDEASKFDDAHLAQYRAVVFLNTSGDVLSDAQEAAFQRYFCSARCSSARGPTSRFARARRVRVSVNATSDREEAVHE